MRTSVEHSTEYRYEGPVDFDPHTSCTVRKMDLHMFGILSSVGPKTQTLIPIDGLVSEKSTTTRQAVYGIRAVSLGS